MKIITIIFAVLCGGVSYAQNDTSRVVELIKIQVELMVDYPDSAKNIAFRTLLISKELDFQKGIVESQTTLGEIYDIQNDSDSSLYFFEQALNVAEEVEYKKGAMDALRGKGRTLRHMGSWDEAIQQFLRCIDLADLKNGDSIIIAQSYIDIGNIYSDQHQFESALKNYQLGMPLLSDLHRDKAVAIMNVGIIHYRLENLEKASDYFLKGLRIAELLNDKDLTASFFRSIGVIKKHQKEFDEAMRYYRLAIKQFEISKDRATVAELYSNIGYVYVELENYSAALEQFKLSHQILTEIDNQPHLSYILLALGITYTRIGKYEEAEQALLQAQKTSSEFGIQLVNTDVALRLSELYAEQRLFKKAYKYHVEYKALNDSIFNETKSNQIAEMEAKYETVEKQKEIELLNANNNINELQLENKVGQRNVLIITTVAFFGLMIVLYNRNKIKSKTNKKLQELDQMKSKFFTNISHEFRTPLTLILGPVDNLLDQKPSEESEVSLQIIKRNAHRLLELINQLLDLSKLEAKQLKLILTKSDIHQFLHTQVSLFQSLTNQREIQLHISIPHEPLEVSIDVDKLQTILSNLLSNAVKFTDKGGSIEVSTAYTEKTIEITVKDSGQGIPSDELPHIFKRFHQLDSAHQHNGTGVGLTLVKELVELHKGTVKVQSEYGQGTEFTIILPLSMEGIGQINNISSEPTLPIYLPVEYESISTLSSSIDEEASTVLVVEDNKEVSEYITSLFSDHYQVLSAVNGKEGLDIALQLVPDIIITDLMMPLMDGIELCAKLKQDERTSHIPIIMLTAKADVDSRIEGLENGADDYLTKPFEQKELKVRIQNLIDQRDKLKTHYSKHMTLAPSQIEVTPPDQVFLEKIMKVVEDKMSDVEFTVVHLQQEMAMSRMQLHRKLKALTGLSASEFVREQRLMRAAEILKIEGMAVAEVAYSTGFNNLSYFAKCFKEKYAISPSKYPNNKS